VNGYLLLGLLILAIIFIVYSTVRLKLHPFLALLIAAFGVGLLGGLPAQKTISAITKGFGNTLGAIGIVIAAGTIIGSLLEKSGGMVVIANKIIKWIGQARSALAMSITGAIVSIPVFCDSGFVILSNLNRSLASKTQQSMALYAVALSMGLYTTHVFVPPTPGPIAAAGTLKADIGTVIILGLLVTIPVVFVTYLFARYMGRRIFIDPDSANNTESSENQSHLDITQPKADKRPGFIKAILPILIPVLLIALGSVGALPSKPFGTGWVDTIIEFLGNPTVALLAGVFFAFLTVSGQGTRAYGEWVGDGLKNAGTIILITGAGGAFGSILQATHIGGFLGKSLAGWNLGIFLPFIIAAALKTAQGSSTVAIITTASILVPLLSVIGFSQGLGPALVTLAIGAGSMTVSHANDSYFWVVSQFSGMDVSKAYRLQTVGSAVAGITGICAVFVLSLFLL
jgi:GntP family gluconate:H+ symporter